MATPPNMPPGGPFPPGDPRNDPRNAPPYSPDPRVQREQERAWAEAQRDQARAQREQAKAWNQYQRNASRQQARAMRQQARMAAEAQRAQMRAWRQSTRSQSIIGPLLLIAVASGALLVYSGRISLLGLTEWLARWWPLVLIAAGLLRLLEWAIARSQAESRGVPVRFAIGGGTVWLLILISALGLAAQGGIHHVGNGWNFGWNGDNLNEIFGSKHEEDAAAVSHSIAANGTLEIHSDRGDVTVEGTSDDGLVHLAEHKEVFASDDGKADKLLSGLNPEFSGTDSALVLRVSGPDSSSAALNLTVPRGVHVVLNSNHGDVGVHSLHAPVSINANRGDVDLSAIVGDIQVRTNSRHGEVQIHSVEGSVQINGSGDEINLNDIRGTVAVNGDFFGSGHLQHVSNAVNYNAGRIGFTAQRIDGDISFDSDDEFTARGVNGPVTVHTRSRNITLERVSGDVQVTNSSGHVSITAVPPTGAITVTNRDGDVTLSLPASAKFSLAADTTDGSVQSSFPGAADSTTPSHHGSLTTTVGSGGPPIRISTTHGNIALERNEEGPLPALPPLPPLTGMPASAQQGLRAAQQALASAQQEMNEGRAEGERERDKALADANRERDKALADANRERDRALADANRERDKALAQANKARAEGQKEAEKARAEAQHRESRPANPTPAPQPPAQPQQ